MGATGRNQICYSESVFRLRKLDRPVLVHRAKSFDGDDGALCVHLFVLQNYSLRSSIGKALILEPLNWKNRRLRRAFIGGNFFFLKINSNQKTEKPLEILKETRFPKKIVDFFDFRNLQIALIVSNSKAPSETLEKISLRIFLIFWFFNIFLDFSRVMISTVLGLDIFIFFVGPFSDSKSYTWATRFPLGGRPVISLLTLATPHAREAFGSNFDIFCTGIFHVFC